MNEMGPCKLLVKMLKTPQEKRAGFWDAIAAWNPFRLIPGGEQFGRRSGSAAEIRAQNEKRRHLNAIKKRQADQRKALGIRGMKAVRGSGQIGQITGAGE